MSDSQALLAELADAFGPSGFEDEVRAVLRSRVAPFVETCTIDAIGNLIAVRRGRGNLTVMLDAHMDEIGLMVSYVEPTGFLRVTPLGGWQGIGGWDLRILPSHAVIIVTDAGRKVKGVIGTTPPAILTAEERRRPHELGDLFVDIGVGSAEEVDGLGIRIGSPAVIAYPAERLAGDRVAGKAFDNRAGCAVLVEALERLSGDTLDVTLVVNFAASEEVGLRGARTAAYAVAPDLALVVECTVAADVPGVPGPRRPTLLGKGPAVTVADEGLIVDPRLVRAVVDLAVKEGIPYQYKVPPYSVTDAAAIQQSRSGVPVAVISVPCRYIHSPFGVMHLADLEHTVALTASYVRHASRTWQALQGTVSMDNQPVRR